MAERPLTAHEQELLHRLLRRDVVGVDALRAQVPLARVVRTWSPGSASLDLRVDAPPSSCPDGPVPGQVWAYGPGGEVLATLLLWVSDGRLSAVEYGWVTDEPPLGLPPVESLRDEPG